MQHGAVAQYQTLLSSRKLAGRAATAILPFLFFLAKEGGKES